MKMLSDLSEIERDDLLYYLSNSMSYHSNAIEGLSLNFKETIKLLSNGWTAHNKPIHEHLIIMGFAEALDFVMEEAAKPNTVLDIFFIKKIHNILFYKAIRSCPNMIPFNIGVWREHEAYITNSDAVLSKARDIDAKMHKLVFDYVDNVMTLRQIADFHILFEQIHPFSDGNGRVGRLLIIYHAIKNNFIPPNIKIENQFRYYDSLQAGELLEGLLEESIVSLHDLLENQAEVIEL